MNAACVDFVRAPEATLTDWANLIRAEYCEMPGLSLTERQVVRLWQLDPEDAKELLTRLVVTGFLRRTANGAYIRIE